MWSAEALKGRHDFYLLVGTASATLLALLFVAVSLGIAQQGPTRTFMSPVVIHFTRLMRISYDPVKEIMTYQYDVTDITSIGDDRRRQIRVNGCKTLDDIGRARMIRYLYKIGGGNDVIEVNREDCR
jgi:hypothetical protein